MTSIEQLQNLVAIHKLKLEPPDIREFNGLLLTAQRMIPDAELVQLSPHSRFQLAYDAAHSLALAALRWHGYRASSSAGSASSFSRSCMAASALRSK